MARAKRKRGKGGRFVRHHAKATNPHRRHHHKRRRNSHHMRNAPRHHRRRRRNPDLVGSIGAESMRAGVAGLGVVAGQVAVRKIRGAVQGMLPATTNVSTGWQGVAAALGAAVVVTGVVTLAVPAKYRNIARAVAAGAMSEAANQALAQTPVAPYLSAFPTRAPVIRVAPPVGSRAALKNRTSLAAFPRRGVAAYPTMRPAGMGAATMIVGH